MRPNTPHVVFTPEHSICFGGHLYAVGTLKDTCIAILQTFVASSQLTNAESRSSWQVLHRMVIYYHQILVENREDLGESDIIVNFTLISLLADVDKSHVPNVKEHDGIVGLTLFCVILELSNVLHSGTYDTEKPMTEMERVILVEARKHAREIIRWLRAFYKVQGDNINDQDAGIDIFEILLWQVSMTLAAAMEDNEKSLCSFLPACTPDRVAGVLYDTFVNGQYGQDSEPWKIRGQLVGTSYDWENGKLTVHEENIDTFPPHQDAGLTEYDICHIEAIPTPSADQKITMSYWLQKASDEPAGE